MSKHVKRKQLRDLNGNKRDPPESKRYRRRDMPLSIMILNLVKIPVWSALNKNSIYGPFQLDVWKFYELILIKPLLFHICDCLNNTSVDFDCL